ncbi:hypothetical protein MGG_02769 [Pyricularia oryzae 70-15]|nr:uncharacterized protein MGG_02769 [Pyricularia oryzae 70-15]EHA46237.1 hypothetical protein MGG_02769 [Pyricularia oryzae 70-15]KAI7921359.1 hypothetical protein M9X92_005449 [Pyricularia oryzae]KAI7921503.1 hypothetical protein M0657_006056 [Pyricularia oryzae]
MVGKSQDIRGFFQRGTKPEPEPKSPSPQPVGSSESSALSSAPPSPASRASTKRARSPTPITAFPPAKRSCSSTPVDSHFRRNTPPRQPNPKPRPRDAVIAASDDEGSDSSDSLEDVTAIWQRVNPNAAAAATARPAVAAAITPPRAKRSAVATTPLTIRAKRMMAENQKYNLDALKRLTQADLEADASQKRVSDMLRSSRDSSAEPDAFEEQLASYEPGDDGKGNIGKQRMRTAIKRVEAHSTSQCYYFFEQILRPATSKQLGKDKFPTKAATGCWEFLKNSKQRSHHFLSGLPQQLAKRHHNLPSELFLWILRQLPIEENKMLRHQYILTAAAAVKNTELGHGIDDTLLRELLKGLGSKPNSVDAMLVKLPLEDELSEPYPHSDWSHVISFLDLLAAVVSARKPGTPPRLTLAATTKATQILLRMGLDRAVMDNTDVMNSYHSALDSLFDGVPDEDWNDFCYEASKSLYRSVETAHLRWQPLSYIVGETPRSHDFRRRLALVFLFDSMACARQAPDESANMLAIIGHVGSTLSIRNDTNYEETAAVLRLLDIAIDDGFGRTQDNFDNQVDELTAALKSVWSNIIATGGGHSSRLDAKTLAEWIPDRLKYTVRTRRPPKSNIYSTEEEEPVGQDIRKMFSARLGAIVKREDTIHVMTDTKTEMG